LNYKIDTVIYKLIYKLEQINEDTSLAAHDINPIAYAPDLISHPAPVVPGLVQLQGQSVCVLSLAVAHSTARPK